MSFSCQNSRRLALPAVLLVGALACALLGAGVPAASADVGETIIQRCTHGQSLGGFSQSAYRRALKELSADAEEYTNCASLIRQAQLAAAGGRGGSSPSEATAVAVVATPAEQRAAHAARAAAVPVRVGEELVKPGVIHADISSAFSTLPSPLLATVVFLLVCLAVFAGVALRNRARGQRPD